MIKKLDNDNNYPVLIDQSIKDIKQHFLKIIEKKKKITTEDVLDFIKKNDASLNSLDDKPKKNTDQFDFVFKDNPPELTYRDGMGDFRGNYIYDSELYSLHGYFKENGRCEYRIFDKTAGVLKRTSKLDALKRVDGFSYLYIEGSKIHYRDTLGAIESFDVNSGTVIQSINYREQYKSKIDYRQEYSGMAFSVLAIIIVVFVKTRNKKTIHTTQELAKIENNFINIKHTTITKEKIDDLLGISHYSYETIKTKRSSIINKLNQNGKIKIERIRKESDKRFYDYKIS